MVARLSSGTEAELHRLWGPSSLTAWQFFNKRYDFLRSNFAKTDQRLFSFRVLGHSVVALSGEEARNAFFDTRSLDFHEGYKVLQGAVRDGT